MDFELHLRVFRCGPKLINYAKTSEPIAHGPSHTSSILLTHCPSHNRPHATTPHSGLLLHLVSPVPPTDAPPSQIATPNLLTIATTYLMLHLLCITPPRGRAIAPRRRSCLLAPPLRTPLCRRPGCLMPPIRVTIWGQGRSNHSRIHSRLLQRRQ
jgi:hypothetical protein